MTTVAACTTPAEIVRPAANHIPSLFACLADYGVHQLGATAQADPDFEPDAILTVRNALARVDLASKCWLADRDGRVLGFCCWNWLDRARGHAKTVLLSVRHDARKLGIGSLLQQRRVEEMREQGASEVHTWSDDPRAVSWYCRRHGYQVLGSESIHHCLHLFTLGQQAWWAIHRGHLSCQRVTHLRKFL
jgi:GNAT superfamily N-acetyltransferase